MTAPIRRCLTRSGAFAGLLLAVLALLLGPAAPASAHAALSSTSPIAGAVLPAAPAEVVLTFTEPVRAVPDKIRVIGPDGSRVDRGEPRFDGTVVTISVDPDGPRGTYLVSYRVVSADSHPVVGGYAYSVGEPSAAPGGATDGNQRVDPVVSTAVSVMKFLGYAGLVLIIGPALVLSLLWPQRLSRREPARLLWAGVGLVGFATLAELWLQVPYIGGGGLFDVDGGALGDVLGSTFGATHLVRLGILAAAAFLLRPLATGGGGRRDGVLLGILGIAGATTWPLAGHSAASPAPTVSVVLDTVHLVSMALWLGGLVMLVGFLLRRADDRELGAILPIWSRWAASAVGALLLAGVVQAMIEVGGPDALFGTTYGRLVITKVALFAVVIALAAYSRRIVLRYRDESRPGRLRRAVWGELAITAVILAVAAGLVQQTPARTAVATVDQGTEGFFSTTVNSSLFSVRVELSPARTGSNTLHLFAYTPDNTPLPVVEWKGAAALPEKGIEPIEIPLLPLTDNHASGEVALPTGGSWQLQFTLRISDIDQDTVTVTAPIPQ